MTEERSRRILRWLSKREKRQLRLDIESATRGATVVSFINSNGARQVVHRAVRPDRTSEWQLSRFDDIGPSGHYAYVTFAACDGEKIAVEFDQRSNNWATAATALTHRLNNCTDLTARPQIVPSIDDSHTLISVPRIVAWIASAQRGA